MANSKPARSEKDLTGCKSTTYTVNYFNYNKFPPNFGIFHKTPKLGYTFCKIPAYFFKNTKNTEDTKFTQRFSNFKIQIED